MTVNRSDRALAAAYWAADDDESEALATNAICARLNIPLDQTEQGLTPAAELAIHRFLDVVEDPECQGHPDDGYGPAGMSTYCDGSCRRIYAWTVQR